MDLMRTYLHIVCSACGSEQRYEPNSRLLSGVFILRGRELSVSQRR